MGVGVGLGGNGNAVGLAGRICGRGLGRMGAEDAGRGGGCCRGCFFFLFLGGGEGVEEGTLRGDDAEEEEELDEDGRGLGLGFGLGRVPRVTSRAVVWVVASTVGGGLGERG